MPSTTHQLQHREPARGVEDGSSGVTVSQPDIAAFRKATLPVVQAFKKRVNSPLVDRALKEAGIPYKGCSSAPSRGAALVVAALVVTIW